MSFPIPLKSGATPRCFEEGVTVPLESQVEAISGDQNDRSAIARIGGEGAVLLDVGKTQTPGKFLSGCGVSGNLERRPAAIAPGHRVIGPTSEDLIYRFPYALDHAIFRLFRGFA